MNNYYEIAIVGRKLAPLTYSYDGKLQLGQAVSVSVRGGLWTIGIVLAQSPKPDFKCKDIESAKEEILPSAYLEMAKFISKYYVCEIGEALALFEIFNPKPCADSADITSSVELSLEQNDALNFLQNHQSALLFGDTGSGKTEIYMKRIDEVLKNRQSALILLPEIALTPQTLARLKSHYGSAVVVWHSKITKPAKKKTLQAIENGSARILIGARSALFVPMPNLGLIVVDEEHDDSFKSDSTPRYNAKDVALWFAKRLNIPIILGSATPSLNSYIKFPYFRLKGGYVKSDKCYIYEEGTPRISPLIISRLNESVANGMQAIVFLPTRANFKYLICTSCKAKIECAFCSVGMSLHKNDKALKCHYCGWSQKTPTKCHVCGGELGAFRIGTMEAAETILGFAPNLSIAVLDKDSASTPKKLAKVLNDFASGETKILVGTQMLSKGHDYGKVGLAVAIGLDNVLASSDFRAREKALSLLIQLAGRAGRKSFANVIIQTQNREFFEKYLNDFEDFLKMEKELRQGMYPPFIRFCRLIFSHTNEIIVKNKTALAISALKNTKNVIIVGHGEALINKIGGKFRYEILIKSDSPNALIMSAMSVREFGASIDMDPLNFN